MKILLLGKNGQVGHELQAALLPLGELVAMGSQECDFFMPGKVAETVRSIAPDIIVNAAAYTNVDKAESEPDLARVINAEAPAVLAEEAKKSGAWLVHYSTDYVFDGTGDKPWREIDAASPINIYGTTKLAGEHAIHEAGCRHLIFRTSWIYAAHGHNFIKTILRLAQERDQLTVINDQIGAPTGAKFIAEATVQALRVAMQSPAVSGLYHVTAAGGVSWHDYARFIVECAMRHGMKFKATSDKILPIPSSAYKTAAKRPHNSRLATGKAAQNFGITVPDWKSGVEAVIAELIKEP